MNVLAANDSFLSLRQTSCHWRFNGNPATFRTAKPSLAGFFGNTCSETTANPNPAATACLIASLLPSVALTAVAVHVHVGRLQWPDGCLNHVRASTAVDRLGIAWPVACL